MFLFPRVCGGNSTSDSTSPEGFGRIVAFATGLKLLQMWVCIMQINSHTLINAVISYYRARAH